MQSVSLAHAHCTALYTLHILHTRYPLLPHHYTPSGVAHNILAGGSMSTQMLYISQKPTNSTKLNSASSVSKAALCLYQQLFNTLAVRELHCISTTHFLGYLYCIHYISCTPWFWVHFMLTSQYMYILELEGAEWCPLVETIVLPHLTCPRLVLGRHLFAGPLPSFESTLPMVGVVHPPSGIHLCKTGRYFWFICRGCKHSNPFQKCFA